MSITDYRVYTDGSSYGNPGPGGYGIVINKGNSSVGIYEGFHRTTNNRMELLAVIVALESIGPYAGIIIHLDSTYVEDGATKWIYGWKKRLWTTSDGNPVKNKDLWIRLLPLLKLNRVKFVKVKAHSGNPGNEEADRLAKLGSSNPLHHDVGFC